MAKIISGLEKPNKGQVLVDAINTSNKKSFLDLRKKVGIVFQNPENQIIFNNIEDELSFALKNLKLNDTDLRIEEALKKVKIDKNKIGELDELSLGQKQKITIAGVLAVNPDYIVFDEPTTMIDSEGKEAVYKIIKNLKENGYTIIYITNNTEEIMLADKIMILDDGKIVEQIKKEDLLNKVDILKKYNLKIPTVITILEKLKKNNIDINTENLSIEGITDRIIEVMNNEKRN